MAGKGKADRPAETADQASLIRIMEECPFPIFRVGKNGQLSAAAVNHEKRVWANVNAFLAEEAENAILRQAYEAAMDKVTPTTIGAMRQTHHARKEAST